MIWEVHMKGIILAGGSGTRLYPLTKICMCEEPIPIDKDNCFIPSNLI